MNVDAIRPAPLLLPGSLLRMANIQFCQSRYSLSFLIFVCVELNNSLGFGRKISLNTRWKLKRHIFSSGLPIPSGMFFNEKIKEIVCDPLITPSI